MAAGNWWSFKSNEERKRPRLDIPLSRTERWLRAGSAAGVLACVALAAIGIMDLFLLAASIFAFAAIEVVSGYPQYFSYISPVTEENAGFQYQSARLLLAWLRAEIIGFIIAVAGLLALAKYGLPDALTVIIVILLFAVTGVVFHGTVLAYFVRLSRHGPKKQKFP